MKTISLSTKMLSIKMLLLEKSRNQEELYPVIDLLSFSQKNRKINKTSIRESYRDVSAALENLEVNNRQSIIREVKDVYSGLF